ncbi:hypothetical protein STRTUCAR8_07143 [Streptomyces turgidiscabies Car8]|uniref:Uncharacterized protein n=1 Tax=Streptomyces turgidiscabies (strain Car8) TaxID=698760 RepID=L7FDX1_STRT8|nr:hypothetical protein STRTUCAR8_07143 [Streptomyces turgidiscabies Car8]
MGGEVVADAGVGTGVGTDMGVMVAGGCQWPLIISERFEAVRSGVKGCWAT